MSLIREIGVGDYVRSYDFNEDVSSYVEGTVVDIVTLGGCYHYKIKVERRVLEGVEAPQNKVLDYGHVYPPVNGTLTTLGRVTNSVESAIKE